MVESIANAWLKTPYRYIQSTIDIGTDQWELKERPDYLEMYETLKSERMVKLSRLHAHFGSAIFLEGPEAIPLDYDLLDEVKL